jgi:hypothetical protein
MDQSGIDPILSGEKRRICWEFQGRYIECLEANERQCIYREEKKVNFKCPPNCEALRELTLSKCPQSWVRHFEFKWAKSKILGKGLDEFGSLGNL